jgi:HlyD family secretion protein
MTAKNIFVALAVCAVAVFIGWRYLDVFQSKDVGLILYGNVDIRQVDLAFDAEGTIGAMQVEEGASVKAGQTLALLRDDTYRSLHDLAKARSDAEQAVVDKLKAGSRPEEIARDRANVAAYEAVLVNADRILARRETLLGQGFAAQQAYDEAEAISRQTEAQLDAAKQTLRLSELGPRIEDLAAEEAQLRAAQAALALADDRLAHCRLVVPADGVVLSRNVEKGAVVLPTTSIYTLALTGEIWVRSALPETALSQVHPGDVFIVQGDHGEPYRAVLGFISPTAEFTPKTVETPELRTQLIYRIRLKVEGSAPGLRQGMPVTLYPAPG